MILVALSGGGDSVALLTVLTRIGEKRGFHLEAAHVNHALRGGESDEDEAFVRRLCERMGIPLSVERLTEGYCKKNGISIETAAREARLAFLLKTATERGASRIATGHTQDDQAETVLQRLLRGTGPAGLMGIRPLRDDIWIRPLLDESRESIRRFLDEEGIAYRDDSSNDSLDYFRNRLRHDLIPYISERFSPRFTAALSRLARLSHDQEDYFEQATASAFTAVRIVSNPYKILLDKSKFVEYHNVVRQRIIRHCLCILEGVGRDTDMNEINRIESCIARDRDEIDITADIRCGTGGTVVAFERRHNWQESVPLTIPGVTVIPCGGGYIEAEIVDDNGIVDGIVSVLLDVDCIERFGALTVGPLKSGERFTPFGMTKPVKIIDSITGSLLPKLLRRTIPVVRAGGVPVWVPGLKSTEELRMRDCAAATHRVARLSFKDGIRWL